MENDGCHKCASIEKWMLQVLFSVRDPVLETDF